MLYRWDIQTIIETEQDKWNCENWRYRILIRKSRDFIHGDFLHFNLWKKGNSFERAYFVHEFIYKLDDSRSNDERIEFIRECLNGILAYSKIVIPDTLNQ